MRSISGLAIRCSLIFGFTLVVCLTQAFAQETVVPAGTLIHCTLEETNFSSVTAKVGDPILCHLSNLQEFGRTVFPRGSYIEGHLEAYKDPGHFVGKGYLRLAFDRIGLPNTDVSIPTKIVFIRGYRVDREGDIVGHGHAKRDAAEWLLPPLWPWKVVSLPAKGPRPALRGEEQLTLRLMEDVIIPALGADRHFSGESSKLSSQNRPLPPFADFYVPESATGKVQIETAMQDAGVYVDGGFVGTAGQLRTFKLRAGGHDIEVRAVDGYSFYQARVNVPAGKTLKITP